MSPLSTIMLHREAQPGTKRALARLELLCLLGAFCVAGYFFLPAMNRSRVGQRREACLANLERIGRALEGYLQENDQHWPYVAKLASFDIHDPPWPTLPAVLKPHTDGEQGIFQCPADQRVLAEGSQLAERSPRKTTYFETEGTSYEWRFSDAYGGKRLGEESLAQARGFGFGRADQPLIADFEPFHTGDEGGSFNTLNADLKPRTTRAKH